MFGWSQMDKSLGDKGEHQADFYRVSEKPKPTTEHLPTIRIKPTAVPWATIIVHVSKEMLLGCP